MTTLTNIRQVNCRSFLHSCQEDSCRIAKAFNVRKLRGKTFEQCTLGVKYHHSSISYQKNSMKIKIANSVVDTAPATSGCEISPVAEPVLVVGALGGVGQLVVAALLEAGHKVRALTRSVERADAIFGQASKEQLQVVTADLRKPETLQGSVLEGVGSVIVCIGTTAFPSKRWNNGNGPEQTDGEGNRNLLAALPTSVQRIVFVSSVGVTRADKFPFLILNLFGVLTWKKKAEEMVQSSGIPYTIFRPGRLTDGPYTSYDLNTLLKATSGLRRAAVVAKGDSLSGEASRILVAEACVQALSLPSTIGQIFAIESTEGDGPGKDTQKWDQLFKSAK